MSESTICFRNENTDEVVEAAQGSDLLERLTGLSNWHRLDGETVELGEEEVTLEDLESSLGETDDDALLDIYRAARRECESRGLALDAGGTSEVPPTTGTAEASQAVEAKTAESSASTEEPAEIDATDAATELAVAEGIDLTKIIGTGANGRIGINDVRQAVEAKTAE